MTDTTGRQGWPALTHAKGRRRIGPVVAQPTCR